MLQTIHFIDRFTTWVGRSFAWLILLMAFGMGYEVLSRYLFTAPTAWAYDMSYILYGTLFMVGGAYTLSRNAHVRGDFLYRLWKPRTQAIVELILYFLFFFPGVLALVFAGASYAARSWRYMEVSSFSPAGIPIFHFKTMLVVGGALLLIQGVAQVLRCIVCIRSGEWPPDVNDVTELEDQLLEQGYQEDLNTPNTGVSNR
ncbi:tripartite ATP-independent periplasmic transporter DctQ [Spiribacter salinus M19-40]|jgi:TRAP-type mannitol/chloroaromatic compound transport system permease small subunit|uniref:TRAP transporter small permease protein n=1 Tax=Spiribacter salinus M19-40 TaxID=1260251 RepID=R4VLE9_9GAMM|nr:TRAP transporter small permease subunit [Spiribacter salinus]AGM41267.1 tripartite ATP-independent periplasmic transporter DctQ [Spiribacter salinus M19-40]MBY5268858.1 TRAP dicarboxylate transporter subunit DctQ [Spiribacter salinus]MDR9412997.1 TRAP transporter small permease subunit [Spiribacter sp.]MDR9454898.1 TRAP transporter small permease subunit [Spiribacter sp.]